MAQRTYTHVVTEQADGPIERMYFEAHMVQAAQEDGFEVEESRFDWLGLTRKLGVLGPAEDGEEPEAWRVVATFWGEEVDPGHVGEVRTAKADLRG